MQGIQTQHATKVRRIAPWLALFLAGPLFLAFTNPRHLPLPLLVVPFIWLFVVIYMSISRLVCWRWPGAPRKRRLIVAGVGGALPVLLLVFESIHQLTAKDFLLATALVACISFYIARADFIA